MRDWNVTGMCCVQLTPPGLHVVHIAVEMAPICKVGGLGDVVTALGRAVQELGHQVEVILPRCATHSSDHIEWSRMTVSGMLSACGGVQASFAGYQMPALPCETV